MGRKPNPKKDIGPKFPTPTTPEAHEAQLITLAFKLAEEQLRDGTASSQTINHFLRLGSSEYKNSQEDTKVQLELTKAKTNAIASTKEIETLYQQAMDAMATYSGNKPVRSDEEIQ